MICKKCGQEVVKKAVVCTGCGCKIKKPIYKRWWLWVVVVVVIAAIGSSAGNSDNNTATEAVDSGKKEEATQITYEVVDLQTMFDELDQNAMKAEKNYHTQIL